MQLDLAQVLRLVAQHLLGERVFERLGIAKYAVQALVVLQRNKGLARRATGIDLIARAHQEALICAGNQARGLLQGQFLHDQGFGQEGLDQMHLDGGNGQIGQTFRAHARRQLDGFIATAAGAQAGVATTALQVQGLAGVNTVGVGNGLHIHAPQLGPAPGLAQKQTRDAPQRIALAHGVAVGGVGRQSRKRHPLLRHLLGNGLLLGGDRVALRPGVAGADSGNDGQCARRGNGFHRIFFP